MPTSEPPPAAGILVSEVPQQQDSPMLTVDTEHLLAVDVLSSVAPQQPVSPTTVETERVTGGEIPRHPDFPMPTGENGQLTAVDVLSSEVPAQPEIVEVLSNEVPQQADSPLTLVVSERRLTVDSYSPTPATAPPSNPPTSPSFSIPTFNSSTIASLPISTNPSLFSSSLAPLQYSLPSTISAKDESISLSPVQNHMGQTNVVLGGHGNHCSDSFPGTNERKNGDEETGRGCIRVRVTRQPAWMRDYEIGLIQPERRASRNTETKMCARHTRRSKSNS